MESSGSLTDAGRVFRLLDLPNEIIQFIFEYIALLDYDYPESRRPQITPIEALAFTYNYRIRQLAAPPYFRCRGRANHPIFPTQYVIDKRQAIDPFELTYLYGRRPLVDGSLKQWRRIESFIFGTGQLYSMADDDDSVVPWQAFPNLRHLQICSSGYPYHLLQSDEASPPKSLTSITIGPQATLRWLQHFSEPSNLLNTVTVDRTKRHRNIGERLATFNTWEISSDFWRRLRSFTLRLPSPSQFGGTKAVERYLEGFEPATMTSLRSLSVSECIDQTQKSTSRPLTIILPSLAIFSGGPHLSHLTLDIHFSCTPDELSSSVSTFPTLQTLHLGDRLEWKGSRSDLIASLTPLQHLHSFSSRTLPDTPSSRFSSFPSSSDSNPSNSSPPSPSSDDNIYCTPREMALELAAAVPKLSLIGWAGRSSEFDWFRIGKNEGGEPVQVDEVTLYSTDLSRW